MVSSTEALGLYRPKTEYRRYGSLTRKDRKNISLTAFVIQGAILAMIVTLAAEHFSSPSVPLHTLHTLGGGGRLFAR